MGVYMSNLNVGDGWTTQIQRHLILKYIFDSVTNWLPTVPYVSFLRFSGVLDCLQKYYLAIENAYICLGCSMLILPQS
jgi:hypothetical protein